MADVDDSLEAASLHVDDHAGEDSGSDDNETLTAAEVLKKLEVVWRNEKFSPELLDEEGEVVEIMLEQVHEMEENIEQAKKGDLRAIIHRMEVDRIRYMVTDYLRIRIKKIEKFSLSVLEEHDRRQEQGSSQLLTPEELIFAQQFKENLLHHYKSLALRHMPPNMQEILDEKIKVSPDLNHYVFLKVLQDVEGVVIEEEAVEGRDEVIDLEEDSQYIMPYKPVANLIRSGQVQLI